LFAVFRFWFGWKIRKLNKQSKLKEGFGSIKDWKSRGIRSTIPC